MTNNLFFENISYVADLEILNKFLNLMPKKHTNVSSSSYKFYVNLIKKYRYLGILSSKNIKYIKIKGKNNTYGYFKEKNL